MLRIGFDRLDRLDVRSIFAYNSGRGSLANAASDRMGFSAVQGSPQSIWLSCFPNNAVGGNAAEARGNPVEISA